jgi:hypothetical protein
MMKKKYIFTAAEASIIIEEGVKGLYKKQGRAEEVGNHDM